MAHMVKALLQHFDQLSLSSVVLIPPVGMNSHRDFLNAVAFLETEMDAGSLKSLTNQIEIELGRQRHDPDSKIKDRPADIDILAAMNLPEDLSLAPTSITDEYFLYPLIEQLINYLSTDNPATSDRHPLSRQLTIDDLSFGESPTTIYRNGNTGQKRVG
ncbi:7, 8-dihydro-6-hydroxymethylpterin- pyrophosphokinase [Methylophaga lonarensis MPL]|uniref:2-amino-4-hydroxy-6-hydroxymethyldihydropteridine diphosphokinase n=2 Tax=Methylophaga lonarensis TaxID=999151 RepID=M7P3A6_9GAMM|nr:7, 8-dihydro-6-hydroxymethylpterin- pyrophosphokinase [Methylophaga lonarensis MPL]